MSLFSRIKTIIRSNINSSKDDGFSSYDYNDLCAAYAGMHGDADFEQASAPKQEKEPSLEEQYYANLELPYGAGFDEIKAAYKRLLKKYHPDKFYGDEKKLAIAQNVVKKLNEAYEYFCKKYN